MKRHSSLIPLSEDHHQALLLAMILKKNSITINNLPTDIIEKMNFAKETYYKELEHRFKDDEEFAIPYISGKDEVLNKLILEIIVSISFLRVKCIV